MLTQEPELHKEYALHGTYRAAQFKKVGRIRGEMMHSNNNTTHACQHRLKQHKKPGD